MRIPVSWLAQFLIGRVAEARAADYVVRNISGEHYLRRWWLIPRNPLCNIYLHHFLRDDDDRALHDHPWWSASIMLRGEVLEWYFAHPAIGPRGSYSCRVIEAGSVVLRSARFAHRLTLFPRAPGGPAPAAWTLFITGPRVRPWGFHCPRGWVPWQQFTSPQDKGAIGRGCA